MAAMDTARSTSNGRCVYDNAGTTTGSPQRRCLDAGVGIMRLTKENVDM